MRRELRRRAPTTDAATAEAASTNAISRRSAPSEAMAGLLVLARGPRRGPRLRFVLRRALRHHAVGLHLEAVSGERPLEHDFRFALERVGHHAGVRGAHELAVTLHLEPVVQRVGLAGPRV